MRVACPACEGALTSREHAGFAFVECATCGYGRLADGASAPDYWSSTEGADAQRHYWVDAKRDYFDSALSLLRRLAPGRRLLDVGGGIGYFAERALASGWDARSLDISPTATAFAAARLGEERAWESLPEGEAGSFDAVTLWCVIAHTTEPASVLGLARRALRRDGILWLTTPNFSFQKPYARLSALAGRRLDFAAHDHVGHFSARALATLLQREGFEDVRFHFRGITETCVVASSDSPLLVGGKRLWNRFALAASRAGLPNATSELQATARLERA